MKLNAPENHHSLHARNGQCWWKIHMWLLLHLRKYSATEKFVCSTALTTSGKNCLEAIVQKEILYIYIWKQRGKKDDYSIPWFLHFSGEDILRQPSWTPLHSTLCRFKEFGQATQRTSDLLENDIGLLQSCATWHHGKQYVQGHFHTCAPNKRARYNSALYFHKDLSLAMSLTSSKRP